MIVYSARYHIDIGPHVFPTRKYPLVQARLLESGLARPSDLVEPAPAGWDELALVHTAGYLARVRTGALTAEELTELELPMTPAVVDGFRTMVGGTVMAAAIACGVNSSIDRQVGCAVNIGGGLHHAFPNHGEGFCLFNDVAVAVRVLQARGVQRHAIIDLDVHHGNGTAFIFESDPRVFTFSMHQQHNYPAWKPRGSLDIGLPDGTDDRAFLRHLERALPAVMAFDPHCVFYLAGADPFEGDQLGGLQLTKQGLRERDRVVVGAVRRAGVPLVITLAGGYALNVEDTVAIHVATIEEAGPWGLEGLPFVRGADRGRSA
ncbi:MAG: histone deacetylase [Acidobacteriota bacterium]